MQLLQLYGKIDEHGEFFIYNKQRLEEWCRQNPGKSVRIRLDRNSSKRSIPQNNYYRGVVIREVTIRLQELGNVEFEDDDVHYMMKQMFNYREVPNEHGEALKVPMSTTILTTTGFAEYVQRIRDWAYDFLGIYIPEPNEQIKTKL